MSRTYKKKLSKQQKDKKKYLKDIHDPTVKHPRNKYLGIDEPYRYQKPRGVLLPDEPSPKAKELLKQGKKVYFL